MIDEKTLPAQPTETERLFANLDKPSLHALSYALRHPDTWPEGFIWDYHDCRHCAMGLAHCLWRSIPAPKFSTGASVMARSFGLPYAEAKEIFMGEGAWVPKQRVGFLWLGTEPNHDAVTPEMVADQIDKYLASVE